MEKIISIIVITIGAVWLGFLVIAFFGKLFTSVFSYFSRHKKRGMMR